MKTIALAVRIALATAVSSAALVAASAQAAPAALPQFKVDPYWPNRLPNNWLIGQIGGIAVDPVSDHIWVAQRPSSLGPDEKAATLKPPTAKCCVPAPSILEFTRDGKLLRSWGKPADGSPWLALEHGIYIDAQGFVWLTGTGPQDGTLYKYTQDGKFVMKVGHDGPGVAKSNDTTKLARPAGVYVDVGAKEVYVADGYINRRVIVFDSETGAYKRHWGAYGKPPIDPPPAARPPAGTEEGEAGPPAEGPPTQFKTAHCVIMSKTGLVYVCDRGNNRMQVFQKNGTFVKEVFIEPSTRGSGSVGQLAFWQHGGAEYLINADVSNNEIQVIDPNSGAIVGRFGASGRMAGEFHHVHALAVDKQGDIYTGEVAEGKRVQKFTPIRVGGATKKK